VGRVDAVELVTLGQRRGLGLGGGDKRYVVDVSVDERRVVVGSESDLLCTTTTVDTLVWPHADDAARLDGATVLVQGSAHGARAAARIDSNGGSLTLTWERPQRRISPGQTVVFYDRDDTVVLGGGIVTPGR
jgi:tRNA-specific 2-thiouridylase